MEALEGSFVAGVSAALGVLGKMAIEVVRRGNSRPPPPPPCCSPEVEKMVREMHPIVTALDLDGAPRVQNKHSVEGAILETARASDRANELLGEILETLRDRKSRG